MQVTVAVASDISEADEIQARLSEAGIASSLEPAEGADPGPVGDGPCRVLVLAAHAETALDVGSLVADDGSLRRLTSADNQVEAEMIAAFLAEEGIRCLIRRTAGFDVPEFLAAGPRELLVRTDDLDRAKQLVESHFGLN